MNKLILLMTIFCTLPSFAAKFKYSCSIPVTLTISNLTSLENSNLLQRANRGEKLTPEILKKLTDFSNINDGFIDSAKDIIKSKGFKINNTVLSNDISQAISSLEFKSSQRIIKLDFMNFSFATNINNQDSDSLFDSPLLNSKRLTSLSDEVEKASEEDLSKIVTKNVSTIFKTREELAQTTMYGIAEISIEKYFKNGTGISEESVIGSAEVSDLNEKEKILVQAKSNIEKNQNKPIERVYAFVHNDYTILSVISPVLQTFDMEVYKRSALEALKGLPNCIK